MALIYKFTNKVNGQAYIANGKRRSELTKDYIVPLRKNIKENQEIYNKKFLAKEGD